MIATTLLNYGKDINLDILPELVGVSHFQVNSVKGIGAACNNALDFAFKQNKAEYCLILANDIVEPHNTIELRLEAFKSYPNAGIVAVPADRQTKPVNKYLAGNFMIKREVYEKIGHFTQEWDNSYGAVDLHYTVRATLAGFDCVNVLGVQSKHLDNGDTAYGFSKKQELKKTYPEFKAWERSQDKELYLIYNHSK